MGWLGNIGQALGVGGVAVDRASCAGPGDGASVLPPLIARVRALDPAQVRRVSREDYFEGVIRKDRMAEYEQLLGALFGEPAKPFGARAEFRDGLQELVDSRGGIEREQCLYLRCFQGDGRVAFAALWPWSDGRHVTLKIGSYD